jgi:hypothetical protein
LLTCATASTLEVQFTWVVQSWVEESLKVQVAFSSTVVPSAIDGGDGTVGSTGAIWIEVRVAAVTVTAVVAV